MTPVHSFLLSAFAAAVARPSAAAEDMSARGMPPSEPGFGAAFPSSVHA